MPLYSYRCRHCLEYVDMWLDTPQETMMGDGCGAGPPYSHCVLDRQWTAPGIGRMSGGASPSRGPG